MRAGIRRPRGGIRTVIAAGAVLVLSFAGSAVAEHAELTLAHAKAVASAAVVEATRLGAPGGAIAVVDAGGHLVHLERLDGTFPAAAAVATEKARTAAVFRRPTADFESAVNGGRNALLGVDLMTPLQGGVPLLLAGSVVGAVGVSGAASAQQDEEIARAAAASADVAAGPPAGDVRHFAQADVDAAFARGAPLLENGAYKIHASRRTEPGTAEVHAVDTDLIYVRQGRATLVTGGRVLEPRGVAPEELRGSRIEGGASRELAPGDVVVVPHGTPHWFEAVEGPFLYYVVKVSDGRAER